MLVWPFANFFFFFFFNRRSVVPSGRSHYTWNLGFQGLSRVRSELAERPPLLNRLSSGSESAACGESLPVTSFESTVAASEKSRWRAVFNSHSNGSWEALGECSPTSCRALAQKDTGAASGSLVLPPFRRRPFFSLLLLHYICWFYSRRWKKSLPFFFFKVSSMQTDVHHAGRWLAAAPHPFQPSPPRAGEHVFCIRASSKGNLCLSGVGVGWGVEVGAPCSDRTNKRPLRRPQTGPLSSKPCCQDFTSTLLMNMCEFIYLSTCRAWSSGILPEAPTIEAFSLFSSVRRLRTLSRVLSRASFNERGLNSGWQLSNLGCISSETNIDYWGWVWVTFLVMSVLSLRVTHRLSLRGVFLVWAPLYSLWRRSQVEWTTNPKVRHLLSLSQKRSASKCCSLA